MAGYCGTEQQQRLQRRAEETFERASTVAGYCNGGRVVTIDDIDAVGWDAILAELKRDGALASAWSRQVAPRNSLGKSNRRASAST